MITFLIAIPVCIMLFFPKTDSAKWLHRHLVKGLIDSVVRFERQQFIYFILMIIMMHSLLPLMSAEMATLIIADLAVYYDAAITLYVASFIGRSKSAWMAIKARCTAIFRLSESGRDHGRKGKTKPATRKRADNDDPDPVFSDRDGYAALAA